MSNIEHLKKLIASSPMDMLGKKKEVAKKMFSQHEQTKKNNSLMIKMDRKREKNRIANESKNK